jgi:predicted peptidase
MLALFAAALPAYGQPIVDGFEARRHTSPRGTMPYRLFVPPGYDRQKAYALVLWLHGAGGRGTDNLAQISADQVAGTRLWTSADSQAKHPAFVLVPQSSRGWVTTGDLSRETLSEPLTLVLEILDGLRSAFNIDPQRLYVAGQSDGGYGTWDLITKRPQLFAAAIAVCGGGAPARVGRVAAMPIWAFHGDADKVVPVNASREMIAALRKAGGMPRYTEYKGVGHDSWPRAFAEPGVTDWLFAQSLH